MGGVGAKLGEHANELPKYTGISPFEENTGTTPLHVRLESFQT